MNKNLHKFKSKLIALSLTFAISLSSLQISFADSANVVTLGADLTEAQKQTMLNYFGVDPNQVVVLEVNNQEEREYLEGIASNAQIGTKTYSCAYVEPTKPGNGINVKTANITWVSASMVANTLSTAGMTDANVIIAANFPVSGTGALTGIMKAFEDATGQKLDETKKEIASEELVITGQLGETIQTESNDDKVSQDKATAIMNDIKLDIIKNNTKDTTQIAQTINNVTNNYNVNLSDEQMQKITDLMVKVAEQNYDYKEMKTALEDVKNSVNERLEAVGEEAKKGVFEAIQTVFSNIGDFFSNIFTLSSNEEETQTTDVGILNQTNDEVLGENVTVDATDKSTIELPTKEETVGFFQKIINWFKDLFNFENTTEPTQENNIENNTTTDENLNTEEVVPQPENNLNDITNENSENLDQTNEETPQVSPEPIIENNQNTNENTTNETLPNEGQTLEENTEEVVPQPENNSDDTTNENNENSDQTNETQTLDENTQNTEENTQ